MIQKNYLNFQNGQQTHYRQGGNSNSSEALIMLHASPMSSEALVPIISALGDVCHLIAPDTPGYGQSDPLPEEALNASANLDPYVAWLEEFIETFTENLLAQNKPLKKIGLYGTATGAQIAIEFARNHPDKIDYIILDNAAHFTDADREEIMEKYFPDLSPKSDGSHLQKIWEISESLFQWFPWYQQDEEHRITTKGPIPIATVHATAKAYLNAGTNYDQAYKRAFFNEEADRVLEVKIPVQVIRWEGSIMKKYSDRFDNYDWPENVKMCHCGKSVDDRFTAIRTAISELR